MTDHNHCLIIDAHVHIYDCFNVDNMLTSAYKNIRKHADNYGAIKNYTSLLLLTESNGYNYYEALKNNIVPKNSDRDLLLSDWEIIPSTQYINDNSLLAMQNSQGHTIYIAAGRQIITMEGIEVLALSCSTQIKDGLSIDKTISRLTDMDALVILPWGVGKWLGKRGDIVLKLLNRLEPNDIAIGDISGRPKIWPQPKHFKLAKQRGIKILSGTDPLPLRGEERKVGEYGSLLSIQNNISLETEKLKNIICTNKSNIRSYGKQENICNFFVNQFSMRIKALK